MDQTNARADGICRADHTGGLCLSGARAGMGPLCRHGIADIVHTQEGEGMSFRRMSGIRLPYRRQGLIYFTLLSYEDMGKAGKKRIDAKLLEAAYGEEAFAAALRDWCCGKMTVQAAAIAHGVSESTLYRARKRLYEAW